MKIHRGYNRKRPALASSYRCLQAVLWFDEDKVEIKDGLDRLPPAHTLILV